MPPKKKLKVSRAIFRGSTEELIAALRPEVQQTRFVLYHESPDGTKLNKQLIQSHSNLIRCLHRLMPNLSFRRNQMEQALSVIADEKGWFPGQPSVKKEWREVQCRRLRAMARHFAQASGKARGAHSSWVKQILQVRPRVVPVHAVDCNKYQACMQAGSCQLRPDKLPSCSDRL